MSLENEYYAIKTELKVEQEKLAKFESLDETQMDEMQRDSRNRGIRLCKDSIEECSEILEEIKEELIEFIENGGEVSELTIKEVTECDGDNMDIKLIVRDFEEGTTFIADEHPIVDDKEYCEVLKTPSKLRYEVDGCICGVTGYNMTYDELVTQAIKSASFGEWMEQNWNKTFSDVGLPAPEVFDFEEGMIDVVNSINQYVNNCRFDDNYDDVVSSLQDIAIQEIDVIVID